MQNVKIRANHCIFLICVTQGTLVLLQYFVLQRPGAQISCVVFKCAVSNMVKLGSIKIYLLVVVVLIDESYFSLNIKCIISKSMSMPFISLF